MRHFGIGRMALFAAAAGSTVQGGTRCAIEAGLQGQSAEELEPDAVSISIISAPGDFCGGTRRLPDRSRCPGCRACS